jgi:hypothetical protein
MKDDAFFLHIVIASVRARALNFCSLCLLSNSVIHQSANFFASGTMTDHRTRDRTQLLDFSLKKL